jgi:hypothetical protein
MFYQTTIKNPLQNRDHAARSIACKTVPNLVP